MYATMLNNNSSAKKSLEYNYLNFKMVLVETTKKATASYSNGKLYRLCLQNTHFLLQLRHFTCFWYTPFENFIIGINSAKIHVKLSFKDHICVTRRSHAYRANENVPC